MSLISKLIDIFLFIFLLSVIIIFLICACCWNSQDYFCHGSSQKLGCSLVENWYVESLLDLHVFLAFLCLLSYHLWVLLSSYDLIFAILFVGLASYYAHFCMIWCFFMSYVQLSVLRIMFIDDYFSTILKFHDIIIRM